MNGYSRKLQDVFVTAKTPPEIRHSLPLLYGEFIPLIDRPDEIVYQRIYLGQKVTVEINRKSLTYKITEE